MYTHKKYIYLYILVYKYIYMHIYMHIYIHLHTHVNIRIRKHTPHKDISIFYGIATKTEHLI